MIKNKIALDEDLEILKWIHSQTLGLEPYTSSSDQ